MRLNLKFRGGALKSFLFSDDMQTQAHLFLKIPTVSELLSSKERGNCLLTEDSGSRAGHSQQLFENLMTNSISGRFCRTPTQCHLKKL